MHRSALRRKKSPVHRENVLDVSVRFYEPFQDILNKFYIITNTKRINCVLQELVSLQATGLPSCSLHSSRHTPAAPGDVSGIGPGVDSPIIPYLMEKNRIINTEYVSILFISILSSLLFCSVLV